MNGYPQIPEKAEKHATAPSTYIQQKPRETQRLGFRCHYQHSMKLGFAASLCGYDAISDFTCIWNTYIRLFCSALPNLRGPVVAIHWWIFLVGAICGRDIY
ncbi:MAG: hypothetical protein OXH00_04470 [Candidatus Poribacteria bacterium]|nr:hypothetical protein [Candidatus Poribacteria bacterium]